MSTPPFLRLPPELHLRIAEHTLRTSPAHYAAFLRIHPRPAAACRTHHSSSESFENLIRTSILRHVPTKFLIPLALLVLSEEKSAPKANLPYSIVGQLSVENLKKIYKYHLLAQRITRWHFPYARIADTSLSNSSSTKDFATAAFAVIYLCTQTAVFGGDFKYCQLVAAWARECGDMEAREMYGRLINSAVTNEFLLQWFSFSNCTWRRILERRAKEGIKEKFGTCQWRFNWGVEI